MHLMGFAAMEELSLDGRLTTGTGVLPAAMAMAAEAMGLGLVCPQEAGSEAAWAGGRVIAPSDLIQAIAHFTGQRALDVPGGRFAPRTIPRRCRRWSGAARAYHRVLKVALTITDLEGCTGVHHIHIAEALSYRAQ
jgi:predicted ATPase with chaperone activity